MRCLFALLVLPASALPLEAADPPLVEQYLHSGRYEQGEQDLLIALSLEPDNDQVRFGLGVLQFLRGVERLGQSLHRYGIRDDSFIRSIPFLRLPVPANPQPEEIDYSRFRKMLDEFIQDLSRAEVTLAGIKDEHVKLPLKLAAIKLDFDSDGEATVTLMDVLARISRQDFELLRKNPEFKVTFDRGDVPWLRSYCHLLTAMLDLFLSADLELSFDFAVAWIFEKVVPSPNDPDRQHSWEFIRLQEPHRLGKFRRHLVQVTRLNHESWKYIRAEKDDDFEWLPNPQQTGVFEMPVTDEMIDAWLAMMDETRRLLEGKKAAPALSNGRKLNLKTLFDDPPERFRAGSWSIVNLEELPDRYFTDMEAIDEEVMSRPTRLFAAPAGFSYALWFN